MRKLLPVLLLLPLAACAPQMRDDYAQAPIASASSVPGQPLSGAAAAAPGQQQAEAPTAPAVPAGFRADLEASLVGKPGGMAVEDTGDVLVIEDQHRLVRLTPAGGRDLVAEGAAGTIYTGVATRDGAIFLTAHGGPAGGQLMRLEADGQTVVLLEGLPSGDHPIGAPTVGPDGMVYIGVGAVTDAGIVQANAPWRARAPRLHDIACETVTLTGRNFQQDDTQTGAFQPYGHATRPGQQVAGEMPCTSAILRLSQSGGTPQLVAWGLRDPRSLAFTPDGALYVLDGGYHGNGIRTVGQGGDLIFAISPGLWYGWPDASGSVPPAPPLLASIPNPPPPPLSEFALWVRPAAMDIARVALFGGPGQAYIAMAIRGHGYKVSRMNLADGTLEDFAEFPTGVPVALAFSPAGDSLYVLEDSGSLWRIGRDIPIG